MTKSELIKKLTEFPDDMPIELMVDSDEISEEGGYTWHSITKIEVVPWIVSGSLDVIYNDYDDYIESLEDEYEDFGEAEKANPDNFERRIIIYTGA
jgi:hypothetical protein